jgi:multidrug efflux system membrane fusion protein
MGDDPMRGTFRGRVPSIAGSLLGASLCLLAACKREENAYVPPPPAEVGVATPLKQPVTPYLELTGNTVAVNEVNLEARVPGYLQEINYKDGSLAKKGDSLFVIEPAPYQAQLKQAQAKVQSLQAQQIYAQAEYLRQADLNKKGFATQQALDQARAKLDSQNADILDAQAGVSLAAINLGYTNVTAPFDGIVTNHLQSVGALVGYSGPTELATIVQINPIWVTFNVSEQDVLRVRKSLADRQLVAEDLHKLPVEAGLMTEQGYPHKGLLDYAAPEVDPSTGTLLVRGVFDNADRGLLPGYFARVRVPLSLQKRDALLVPDDVLGTNQAGRYLLVVDKDDTVSQRTVTPGQLFGPLREIDAGLEAGDRVVITNIQRAVPGQKVAAKAMTIPALSAADSGE